MRKQAKVAAIVIIIAGGALSGVLAGSSLGPMRLDLEFDRGQLHWLSAGSGMLLAFAASCLATEYEKARNTYRVQLQQMRRLARMHFDCASQKPANGWKRESRGGVIAGQQKPQHAPLPN
jgi:hypothetical protein